MLSRFSIRLIRLYQSIPGFWHNNCRYTPTCSEYTICALERYGFVKGWFKGIKRILSCNPFGGYGYDPLDKE